MGRHHLESLSVFARRGYKLRIACRSCRHIMDASVIEMMSELHRRNLNLNIDAIERQAKCSKCGERKAVITAVMIEW